VPHVYKRETTFEKLLLTVYDISMRLGSLVRKKRLSYRGMPVVVPSLDLYDARGRIAAVHASHDVDVFIVVGIDDRFDGTVKVLTPAGAVGWTLTENMEEVP
jgi:hypothetical protein